MPSTYSPSLRLELIGNGEQAGTWGTTTNLNLGTLLEQAITGVQPITLTGGDYTLTDFNGLSDESRNAVLVLGGLLAAPCNVIAPSAEKTYIVRNFSNATVTIKTASGNGVALTNAASAVVFCDGTDFYSATTLNYIDGNLTVTGNSTLQGSVTMATNANATVTIQANDVYGNGSTGQWFLPVGTTDERSASPSNGLIRYNTTQQIYEGYANGSWVRFQVYPQGVYTLQYLIAAGGGGGGGGTGGGGGAGGLVTGSVTATATTTYTISIGAGGAAGSNGTTSYITGVASAVGGGFGATNIGAAGAGGSGGGGGSDGFLGQSNGANGTTGQGNAGGNGGFAADPRSDGGGGGGGGAGAAGTTAGAYGSPPGNGGVGAQSSITGVATYYCGGGGGGAGGGGTTPATGPGSGGSGGGASGGSSTSPSSGTGGNGGSNTGGGAGGGGAPYGVGGAGGSGVIILSMPTVNYTGQTTGSPVVSTYGEYTVLTYSTSGTYTA